MEFYNLEEINRYKHPEVTIVRFPFRNDEIIVEEREEIPCYVDENNESLILKSKEGEMIPVLNEDRMSFANKYIFNLKKSEDKFYDVLLRKDPAIWINSRHYLILIKRKLNKMELITNS